MNCCEILITHQFRIPNVLVSSGITYSQLPVEVVKHMPQILENKNLVIFVLLIIYLLMYMYPDRNDTIAPVIQCILVVGERWERCLQIVLVLKRK